MNKGRRVENERLASAAHNGYDIILYLWLDTVRIEQWH
jgi:hypothetical protein